MFILDLIAGLVLLGIALWYLRDVLLEIIAISPWFRLRLENSLLIRKVTQVITLMAHRPRAGPAGRGRRPTARTMQSPR